MSLLLAGLAAAGAAGVYAVAVEPSLLRLREPAVTSRHWPAGRPDLRIGVLSDLHAAWPLMSVARVQRIVARLLTTRPDLILLPGDFIQEADARAHAALIAELNAFLLEIGFSAPLGAFAVGGDVDSPDWPAIFAGTAVVACTRRTELEVGGLHLTALTAAESSNLALTLPRAGAAFHVAFGHRPDFALSPRVATSRL